MSKKSPGNGWDRPELNLRLTQKRREKLREIADRLTPGSTPTDAIDYALNSSASDNRGLEIRIDDLEAFIDHDVAVRRQQMDALAKNIDAMSERIKALHALISEVAASEDF